MTFSNSSKNDIHDFTFFRKVRSFDPQNTENVLFLSKNVLFQNCHFSKISCLTPICHHKGQFSKYQKSSKNDIQDYVKKLAFLILSSQKNTFFDMFRRPMTENGLFQKTDIFQNMGIFKQKCSCSAKIILTIIKEHIIMSKYGHFQKHFQTKMFITR